MAELIIQTKKIQNNIKFLGHYLSKRNIHWSLITKVFSGNLEFLKHVLTDDIVKEIYTVGDSRLTSLVNLKKANPNLRTIYIKPPASIYAEDIVKYADVSLNTSFETILALDEAARKIDKVHRVIIMIELGELREGINREDVLTFYEKVFNLSNIDVIGIGSNLGCMYGVEPSFDKLIQLCLYKELISAKFNKELMFISAGTSITLPLLESGSVPKEVNHFRIGEAAFFGVSPLTNERFGDLETDTFELAANIIELEEKALQPEGTINHAAIGETREFDEENVNKTTFKAILDFGLLDVDCKDIEFVDRELTFVGMTSDMIVIDLGKNQDDNKNIKYRVGDTIRFTLNYMAVARLLNSKFIDKVFLEP
jgi:predicted amino acid racemase